MIEIKTVGTTVIEVDAVTQNGTVRSITIVNKRGSGMSACLNQAQADRVAEALAPRRRSGLLWRRPDGAEIKIQDRNEGTEHENEWYGACGECGTEVTAGRHSKDIHVVLDKVQRHTC